MTLEPTRDIGLRLTRFDIRQCPFIAGLSNEFETQNTILSQEHVLRENVHAVDPLGTQPVCQ